jgi:hypothetical protein
MASQPATRKRPAWVIAVYEFLERRPEREAPQRLVAEHAMGLVPPGPAWREGQAKRVTDAKYRGAPPEDLPELERLAVIRNGAKRIVLKSLYHERKLGRIERFDRDGRPWLRICD